MVEGGTGTIHRKSRCQEDRFAVKGMASSWKQSCWVFFACWEKRGRVVRWVISRRGAAVGERSRIAAARLCEDWAGVRKVRECRAEGGR